MAGHIDHGKTTLTKALTGIETDRLKEEKERQISIEPGFAPLVQRDDIQISLIDVPGHERFIRQMIAGVAGIDFAVLVIAADEGFMPQTYEHLHILSLLGVTNGLIAVTKIDEVEAELLELVREDIKQSVEGTFLEGAGIHFVDSVSGRGIEAFKQQLMSNVQKCKKRTAYHSFRLPIDHVFTIKGQGVVVRGTVFDGHLHVGDELTVLPAKKQVRVRQIQSHHKQEEKVSAGQRAALNLGGISHGELKRGDVLVEDEFYTLTSRVDIAFTPSMQLNHPLRQRQLIKLYIGTSEVIGKIIFFDRNKVDVDETEEVLCQLQLEEAIVVTRADRFILRRASPNEMLGGGWIIDANAKKHKFGEKTMDQLQLKKVGSPEDRVLALLDSEYAASKQDIMRKASVSDVEFLSLESSLINIGKDIFTNQAIVDKVRADIKKLLMHYHQRHPLRFGMDKAELLSELREVYGDSLLEFSLLNEKRLADIKVKESCISLSSFQPSYPSGWERRIEQMLVEWEEDGAEVSKMDDYYIKHQIDEALRRELTYYLLQSKRAYSFDEGRFISFSALKQLKDTLYKETDGASFTIQAARHITKLSRKNLVPLLELFDRLQYTERNGNERNWLK